MSSAGGELFKGSSALLKEPLGVVQVGFNGFDMGKTTADSMLTPDQDIKDILYQQDGTKAADSVRTGLEYILKVTFGEINTGLLLQLMSGLSSENHDPAEDSMTFGRCLYRSMRDDEAKVLRVVAVDCDGIPSALDADILNWYEAIPIVNADLIVWGADTQRNIPVEFKIKYHIFADGESTTKTGAFGYFGDPAVEDVPAIVWPNVDAPYILSAVVDLATQITITMSEAVTLVAAVALVDRFVASVNSAFAIPTTAIIEANPNDDTITLTFGAATFATLDVVTLSMTASSVEDADSNHNAAVSGLAVTNTL